MRWLSRVLERNHFEDPVYKVLAGYRMHGRSLTSLAHFVRRLSTYASVALFEVMKIEKPGKFLENYDF